MGLFISMIMFGFDIMYDSTWYNGYYKNEAKDEFFFADVVVVVFVF